MELKLIVAWAIAGVWGLMLLKGVAGLLLDHDGDHSWFVWPPVIFAIAPFAIAKFLFGTGTAITVVVVTNGALVAVALIALAVTKLKERGEAEGH